MGESSSADQVYDTKFCQTVSSRLIASVFVWVLTRIIDEGISKPNDAEQTEGWIAWGYFWQLYVLFCNRTKDRTVLNAGIDYYYCVSHELRTIMSNWWFADKLLQTHIDDNYFVFIFLLCLNLLFVTFAVTNDDSCKKRNDLFCFVWENNFTSIWLCVCLFVCVNSISNGHTVGKEGSW